MPDPPSSPRTPMRGGTHGGDWGGTGIPSVTARLDVNTYRRTAPQVPDRSRGRRVGGHRLAGLDPVPTAGTGRGGLPSVTARLDVTTYPRARLHGRPQETPLHGPSRGWAGEPRAYNRGPSFGAGGTTPSFGGNSQGHRHSPTTRRGVGMWAPDGLGGWAGTGP